jgi:Fe2+ transport system protein FeoA
LGVNCATCGSPTACGGCPIVPTLALPETLAMLEAGARATVHRLATGNSADLRKLLALGVLPGVELEVERRWPAVVVRMGYATMALDAKLAEGVIVNRRV